MAQNVSSPHDQENHLETTPHTDTIQNVCDASNEYYVSQRSSLPEFSPYSGPAVTPMLSLHTALSSSPPPLTNMNMTPRSPIPEYQPHTGSLPMSPNSPSLTRPVVTHSPSTSEGGSRGNYQSLNRFSEYQSPDPERAYDQPYQRVVGEEHYDKSATEVYIVPATSRSNIRGLIKTQVRRKPLCIILVAVILIAVGVAVALAVVFGAKRHHRGALSYPTPTGEPTITGDPEITVGGYLSPTYYSKTGAFNGSGIAVAAAWPGLDQTVYVFYQDYEGKLAWKTMHEDGTYQLIGPVADENSRPLNGTPLSVVSYGGESEENLAYHVFYIQDDYTVVERVLQINGANSDSLLGLWTDGGLTKMKLKTSSAHSIGLQACPWFDHDGKSSFKGLHLWYAASETQFKQYDWVNGSTGSWKFERNWDGLNGYAGVGCQTWKVDSTTEYVFFVDEDQNLAMFWKDYNSSAVSTTVPNTQEWTKDVEISNIHRSSSLGYTSYLLYQSSDGSIHGANIMWDAENTSIAKSPDTNEADVFTIQVSGTNDPVAAVKGTHMSITALKTASLGANLEVFFQKNGDDVSSYTRDMKQIDGIWQPAADVVSGQDDGNS